MGRNNGKERREQRQAVAKANEELRRRYGVGTVKTARRLEESHARLLRRIFEDVDLRRIFEDVETTQDEELA